MKTIGTLLAAIQQFINALLPFVNAVDNIAQSAELYSKQIKQEAKLANAESLAEYNAKLKELGLEEN